MQQATQTLSTSPRGATSEEITRFSSNVASDVAQLMAQQDIMNAQVQVLSERFHAESVQAQARIGALERQLYLTGKLMATRTELEELGTIIAAPSMPQDRGYAALFLEGLGPDALTLDGCTIADGGVALPLSSRRSLLFGNDPLTGAVVMPADLVATFTPVGEGTSALISSTAPRLAMSDNVLQPFARTVSLSPGASSERVSGTLEIVIPPSLRGSLRVNLLELIPYPLGLTVIASVRFYSPVGAALGTLQVNGAQAVTLPVALGAVGRIQIDITGTMPSYESGRRVFRYGLSKVGLYDAAYKPSGQFGVVWNAPSAIKTLQGLSFNTTLGSSSSLVRQRQLRLVVQAAVAGSWQTVYDTDLYRDLYAGSAENSYFPAGGVACATTALRVLGTLSAGGGYPILRDIILTYTS